jgi:hypothetical protein
MYSWNPPWTYTLLAPFLSLPFVASASAWCWFQAAILFFIALKAPQALKVREPGLLWGTYATLFFLPSWYSLFFGQIGTLFALSTTLFLLAVNSKRYGWAGISLVPLTCKAHLFLLCAIPGVLWLRQIPRKDRLRFLGGSLLGFATLVLVTLVCSPTSLTWWLNALTESSPSDARFKHFTDWVTHTPMSGIRILLFDTYGIQPTWLYKVVPASALLVTSLYFWLRRPHIEWASLLPQILCLSLATASYGWAFDQSVLILCQYLLFVKCLAVRDTLAGKLLLCIVCLVQPAALFLFHVSFLPFYFFSVLPLAYWSLLVVASNVKRAEDRVSL